MCLLWVSVFWLGLVPPHGLASNSQALARAVIVRAIAAEGGEERLAQQVATHSRCKGKVLFLGNTSFVGETWTQNGTHVRQLLEIDTREMRRVILVLNGSQGWVSYDGRVEEMAPDMLALVQVENYVDRVTNLVPLLRDKQFKVTWVGECLVDGHSSSEVKVSAQRKPDVLLYFDRETGLLIKREYQVPERGSDKPVTFISRYSDYRLLHPADSEERVLHDAGISTDGPSLLHYLHARCLTDAARVQLRSRIHELGSRSFRTREKAQAAVVAFGPRAVPFLEEACKSTDLEVARRARACLRRIRNGGIPDPAVTIAAVRLIGLNKPAGSASALLALMPFAPNAAVGEVRWALRQLAEGRGAEETAIRKGLGDLDPVKRAAAAEALDPTRKLSGSHRIFLGGIRIPHHIETFRDQEPSMSYDTIAIEYLDRFDPRLFTRP